MNGIEDIEKTVKADDRWRMIQRIGMTLLVVAVVSGLIILAVRDHYRGEAVSNLGTALNSQRDQFEACKNKLGTAKGCQEPVAPPASEVIELVPGPVGPVGPAGLDGADGVDGRTGNTGETGATGPRGPGPSLTEVSNAVSIYCANDRCRAPGLSAAQVAEAVSLYCNDRNQCRGDAGTDGADGSDGTNGDRGPGPTPEQILSAVTTYCNNQPGGSCEGDTGERGPAGSDGATGPAGQSALPFTFTFTVPANGVGGTPVTYTCVVTPESQNNVACTEQAA